MQTSRPLRHTRSRLGAIEALRRVSKPLCGCFGAVLGMSRGRSQNVPGQSGSIPRPRLSHPARPPVQYLNVGCSSQNNVRHSARCAFVFKIVRPRAKSSRPLDNNDEHGPEYVIVLEINLFRGWGHAHHIARSCVPPKEGDRGVLSFARTPHLEACRRPRDLPTRSRCHWGYLLFL